MKIVDLSHTIAAGVETYYGGSTPVFNWRSTFETRGRMSSVIMMSTHTATHVDSPLHFIPGGKTIDLLDPDSLVGFATVIKTGDLPKVGRFIDHEAFLHRVQGFPEGDIAILYSGIDKFFGLPFFTHECPCLLPETLEWLIQKDIKAYVTDSVSVDPLEGSDFPNHKRLLAADIPIVECITNIDSVERDRFFFLALPLKLDGREGSPCRAIALLDF